LQSDFDHRLIGSRAFGHAAVDLYMSGMHKVLARVAAHAVNCRTVEHQRHTLRRRRSAAYARLSELPVSDNIRRFARFADREWTVILANYQTWLINLRNHNEVVGLEFNWRPIAAEQRRRLVAIHFNPEWKSANRFRGTRIKSTCLGLTSAPAFNGLLRLSRRKFPKPRPAGNQRKNREQQNSIAAPGPAA